MIESYIIFRMIAYASVGFIAYRKGRYAMVALCSCLVAGAAHPELIDFSNLGEYILIAFPLAILWVGWDLLRLPNKPHHVRKRL